MATAVSASAQTWTGAVSTDWFTAGNWNGGVPAANSSPTIDSTNPGGQGAVVNAATNALTQLNLGVNAQGLLTIVTGGSILMDDGVLGANAGSTGTAKLTGTGAWNVNNDLVIGGNANNTPGGTGNFTVDGGAVTVGRDTVISASSGGVGTVTVTGGASTWTNTRDIFIGGVTTGTFNVLNGGTVTANRDTYLGYFSGSMGTLTIDGTNSQWTSTGGILDVGGNAASGRAGTGVVNVTNGGTLDTTAAGSDAFLGDGVNGHGTGTVNISGTNSVWNASNVAVGETGTGFLNISNGGVFSASGAIIVGDCDCSNGTVTVSGPTSQFKATGGGAQNVVIGFDGIGAFKALNGATVTVAGEVVVGGGLGNGTLNVESGATFTAGQFTIGAGIGVGTVTVSGAGSVLTSNGATEIGAGGTANNMLSVLDGATGNLGGISVGFFGGTGTLKVDATSQVNGTSYSQNATSTFNVGISQTGNGKVAITGADINLDGALVVDAKTTKAKKYDIMTTDNGVLGTFSSISVVGNANNLQINYAAACGGGLTCVELSVDQFSLANVLPPGTTGNAGHVANALDKAIAGGLTIPDAFFDVFALSGANLVNTLSQLSGEPAAGAAQSNIQLMNSFLSLMLNPYGGAPNGNPGTLNYAREFGPKVSPEAAAAYAAVTPKDRRPDPFAARWGVWGQAYGGYNKLDGNATTGSHDSSARTYGLATGFDYRVSGDTMVGFALAGAGENWGLSDGLGGGRADALQLGAYGSKQFGAAYVSGGLAYAVHNVTTDRTITVAGSNHLTANFTAQSFGGRLETGYRFDTPYAGITPYAAAQVQVGSPGTELEFAL